MMSLWLIVQILAILAAGYLLQRLLCSGLTRAGERYRLPPELVLRKGRAWTGALRQPGVLPRLAGAAVVGTFLGIWMNQAGLTWAEHTGVATTLNQLTPVWLIPLTTLVLGERHGLRSWLSTLLAVAGVILIGLGG